MRWVYIYKPDADGRRVTSHTMSNLEAEGSFDKSVPSNGNVYVNTVDAGQSSDLAHTPVSRFSPKRFAKSLKSKDAWLGDYVSVCIQMETCSP